MPQIHKLDTELINQIAAGEVVERPVSVVKELVENSLDAGATRIRVSLESGGTKLIEVSDDGAGISKDDFPLVFEKHATSKIESLQDLQQVLSFGFRGEALASISSVSETTLVSRQSGNIEGYSISSDNSQIQVVSCEEGTKIRVEHLFARTPARLNYLKTERTEYVKIVEFVQSMALAYPEVSFEILSDGKRTQYFAQNETLQTRIHQIYGAEFAQNMIPLHSDIGTFQIWGAITNPTLSFGNKNKQVLFINHRLIQSPVIYRAVADSYNRYIAPKTFPGYVLHLQIDPTVVDVNVHPRKMELRFADEQSIFRGIYRTLSQSLEKVSLMSVGESQSQEYHTVTDTQISFRQATSPSKESFYTGSGTKFKSYSPYTQMRENPSQGKIQDAMNFSQSILEGNEPSQNEESFDIHQTPLGRIIGQVHRSYILVETPQGMQIFDQHALAERVIYEKLRRNAKSPHIQSLLIPEMIELSAKEYAVLENQREAFESLGFSFELLSRGLVSVSSIPDVMKKVVLQETFVSIIDDLQNQIGKSKTLDEIQNKLWAYTACRSAIKFGDILTVFEMNALLRDAVSDYSSTCPHGRPVIWEVGLEELKKKYER